MKPLLCIFCNIVCGVLFIVAGLTLAGCTKPTPPPRPENKMCLAKLDVAKIEFRDTQNYRITIIFHLKNGSHRLFYAEWRDAVHREFKENTIYTIEYDGWGKIHTMKEEKE